MNRINNKLRVLKLFSYLVALMMVLNCNTVYMSSNLYETMGKYFFPIMVISSLLFVTITVKLNKLKVDNTLLYGILLTIYLGIFFIIINKNGSIANNIRFIVMFLVIFLLVWVEKKNSKLPTVLVAYINIVALIAIVSIFFWLMGTTLHIVNANKSVTLTWGDPYRIIPSYYNLYFETQNYNLSIRNTAIFVEAPMAALNFLIATCLETFFLKNERFYKFKMISLLVAGVLTMSTTFYIGIILIIIFKILNNQSNKDIKLIQILLLIIVIPVLIYFSHILLGEKLASNSGISRSIDYTNAFNAWLSHPFIGNGLDAGVSENGSIVSGMYVSHYGYSSSFTKILGDGGICLLILPILSVVMSLKKWIISKNNKRLILTIIMVYLFFTVIFAQTYLFIYIFIFLAIWVPEYKNMYK